MDIGVLHGLQRPFDHHLQIVEVLAEFDDLLFVLQQFDPQPQARDRGLQIVGNGAEQALPIIDITADAVLHDVDGTGNGDDLAGALFRQRRLIDVFAQHHGRGGEATQGPRLPADQRKGEQEQDRCQQDDETKLVRRQVVILQRHVGGGQQRRQVEPLLIADSGLDHQNRRV